MSEDSFEEILQKHYLLTLQKELPEEASLADLPSWTFNTSTFCGEISRYIHKAGTDTLWRACMEAAKDGDPDAIALQRQLMMAASRVDMRDWFETRKDEGAPKTPAVDAANAFIAQAVADLCAWYETKHPLAKGLPLTMYSGPQWGSALACEGIAWLIQALEPEDREVVGIDLNQLIEAANQDTVVTIEMETGQEVLEAVQEAVKNLQEGEAPEGHADAFEITACVDQMSGDVTLISSDGEQHSLHAMNMTVRKTARLPGVLWATPEGLHLDYSGPVSGGFSIHHPTHSTPKDEQTRRSLVVALYARNTRAGLEPPEEIRAQILEVIGEVQAPGHARLAAKTPHGRGSKGTRLQAVPPEVLRAITAQPAAEATFLLGRGTFICNHDGSAVYAEKGDTRVEVECDPDIGFGPDRAIQVLAKSGPSVVQTYLALCGLWLTKCAGQPYDKNLKAGVPDLLRFMGKRQTNRGGYDREYIERRAQDVHILMRTSIPAARWTNKGKSVTIELTRAVVIESISAQLSLGTGQTDAVYEFKYHLAESMHGWLCGDTPQYAEVSAKLLQYHADRQRYQILLGFAIVYDYRVNTRRLSARHRRISLPRLLNLAAIEIPKTHRAEFCQSIYNALECLAADNVTPGLKVQKPLQEAQAKMTELEILEGSFVEYPRQMIQGSEEALPAAEHAPESGV